MSCEIENIIKGQDCNISLELKDETSSLIDASIFAKLVVIIKHANGTIVAKFSKNTATGYEPIDLTSAAAGIIKLKLLTAHTMACPEGKLFYEIHGQITDGTITDDSVLDLISTNNYLCNITESITGGTTLP